MQQKIVTLTSANRWVTQQTNASSGSTATVLAGTTGSGATLVISSGGAIGNFVAFGATNPVVTTASYFIPANTIVEVQVPANTQKVAALSASGTGFVTIAR